jgi:hypothetical protein
VKRHRILLIAAIIAISAVAQEDPWAPLRVFEGKWEGQVTGKPGKQFSSREYQFELNGKFLSQRDKSVYEPKSTGETPKAREDFGFFSYDENLKKIVWRQFHSEGFVNEYTLDSVSADVKSLEFVTVRIENLAPGWRAKKSYRILTADEIEETFSLAPPGKDFDVYTVAHLKRVK